jgi:tetratricopeptide (TPR) repeat protein
MPMSLAPKFAIVLLLAASALLYCQSDVNSAYDVLLLKAQEARSRSDYATAASAYQQAVMLRPEIPELWANLGLMQDQLSDYSGALKSFSVAHRLKPALYVPCLFLGLEYLHLHGSEKAIPFLTTAQRMNPQDGEPSLALGRAYVTLRDYSAAVTAYRAALTIHPNDSSAWFGIGIAYLGQVESDARAVSSHDPESGFAKADLAESLTSQSRYNQAIDAYKAVLDSPQMPPCMHSELGFVYLRQGNTALAASEFAAQEHENPSCNLSLLGMANMRLRQGVTEDACQLIRQAWNRDHGFVLIHGAMLIVGLSDTQQSSFAATANSCADSAPDAAELAARIASLFHSSSPMLSPAATAPQKARKAMQAPASKVAEEAFRSGHYGECAASLRHEIPSLNSSSQLLLAQCAYLTGDYDLAWQATEAWKRKSQLSEASLYWSVRTEEKLASDALSQAEQLDPSSERTHLLLGDMYRLRKIYDKAEQEYSQATKIAPQDFAALYGLAKTQASDSQMETALSTANRALALNPGDPDVNLLMGEIEVASHNFAAAEPFHALLSQVYEDLGLIPEAIEQLKMALSIDLDGSLHYRLARMYFSLGDKAAGSQALAQTKALEQQQHNRAKIALEDPAGINEDILTRQE